MKDGRLPVSKVTQPFPVENPVVLTLQTRLVLNWDFTFLETVSDCDRFAGCPLVLN